MKKLLALFIFSIALISCEGPMGPQGEPGHGIFWKNYTYTVRSQDWQLVTSADGLNTYYVYYFDNKDITNSLYTDGYALGYWVLYPGTKDEVLTPLPYTIHCGGTTDEGEKFYWTETYTFDYMPGSIAFYVQYSDFAEQRPGDMTFRIVLNN